MRGNTWLVGIGVVLAVAFILVILIWLLWPSLVEGNLVFTTRKMCQLTGEWDKQFNQQTRNFDRGFGITGSDLGFPVRWNDRLIFLFGDTRSTDPEVFIPPGQDRFDSIADAPLNADVDRE
ncbi:MAG TPA: hypothetical protein VFB89_03130, partial [Gemmatimonadales bacterium]|nr:hypothetical protein [Gemmatimonadales bacterium]